MIIDHSWLVGVYFLEREGFVHELYVVPFCETYFYQKGLKDKILKQLGLRTLKKISWKNSIHTSFWSSGRIIKIRIQ